ncbi:PREDICTED: uncharacterized protein LOC108779314, partial [Cyphomyrmex costatus]|uniref:uncharacterized protein LOC108779314 n=1 Tax=Cyphomyrmex costatus TaxID=456900 RepID=UPI0008522D55
MFDCDPENITGNEFAVPIRNNLFAQNVIFDDLPSDSHNIIKILENTIAIKKQLDQQNAFLEQLKKESAPVTFATAGPNSNNLSIIPTKPFKKLKKLLEFDTSLKTNVDGKKQL